MHFKGPDEPIGSAVLSQNSDLYKKNASKGHNLSSIVSFIKESSGFAGISLYNEVSDNLPPNAAYARFGIFLF